MKLRASGETLSVYTVVKTLAVASTVPEIEKALINISSAGGYQRSMGLLSPFGDDIDYRVDGIRSPDGTARAADDFDPVDILKHCVLDLPINACEQRRVNAPAVDKHEHRSGECALESAHTEGPRIGVDPCDFHSGRHAEGLRDACGPGPPDILLGNDVDRCRSSSGFHRHFGCCCNLDLSEFFQAHLF